MGLSRLPKKLKEALRYEYFGARGLKYKNRSCTCRSSHIHHSRLEAHYCDELLLLKKARILRDFEIQHKISIDVNYKHIANHYVDFLVTLSDGKTEFHEVKGYEQDIWKLKRRLVEALYPDIPYLVKK